jgi:hypothetical protein
MKTNFALGIAMLALPYLSVEVVADTFGSGANQFTIDFVTVGNPGNLADTTGNPNPAGSVNYLYNMGKYEVSRDMVMKANSAGGLQITLENGATWLPNMPATGVSWYEAARFVNWLNTSQGFSPAYKFNTQPSDVGYAASEINLLWQVGEQGFSAANPFRNSHARYFLPSTHEWYKAAFYDPDANGGVGGYWNFPTGSDTAPIPIASGTSPGTAVYNRQSSVPADIAQAGGLSAYGTMAQGGNVYEWEETSIDLVNDVGSKLRGMRGGDWFISGNLDSPIRVAEEPEDYYPNLGFRVASIPEPSTWALLAAGFASVSVAAIRVRRSLNAQSNQYTRPIDPG